MTLETLKREKENELKFVLGVYFEKYFIRAHRPWRAVIGNKRCKPIPIHRNIYFPKNDNKCLGGLLLWPNMDEELLRDELKKLGFVLTNNAISVSVPKRKKGKKLTFAQECVKEINYSYSEYCLLQKNIASQLYSEVVRELRRIPSKDIKLCKDGEIMFLGYKIEKTIDSKCYTFLKRLMKEDGMYEYFEGDEYKGLKLTNTSILTN